MNLKLFFLALFTHSICSSQTEIYHPFTTYGSEWSVLQGIYSEQAQDTSYSIQKHFNYSDTLIDGLIYIYFNGGLIRDDELTKKVYLREFFGDIDYLVYDFSLEVGALVNNFENIDDYIELGFIDSAYIASIDSIFLGDNYRRRFNIIYSPPDELHDSTFWWIEGIGSEHGPLWDAAWYFKPYLRRLICYEEETDLLYSDLEAWYTCDSVLLDPTINVIDLSLVNWIYVSPNPFTTQATLIWGKDFFESVLNLTIVNFYGQILHRELIPNAGVFSMDNYFPSGQYHCILSDGNKILTTSFITFKQGGW